MQYQKGIKSAAPSPGRLRCLAEVKKRRGRKHPLSVAALKGLRDEHARALLAEADQLERRLSNCVNEAYGLTPEEIDLMWATAPPRMPIGPPKP